jgi:hypothetical protein
LESVVVDSPKSVENAPAVKPRLRTLVVGFFIGFLATESWAAIAGYLEGDAIIAVVCALVAFCPSLATGFCSASLVFGIHITISKPRLAKVGAAVGMVLVAAIDLSVAAYHFLIVGEIPDYYWRGALVLVLLMPLGFAVAFTTIAYLGEVRSMIGLRRRGPSD